VSFNASATPARYLTADTPGIGGVIKQRPEDFIVEEIPAYEPCGSGEHIYLWVQKTGLSTLHLVRLLAEHFGVRRDAVGVAGLKDKHAVTTQMVSVHTPGKGPEDFPSFERPGVSVLWADLHTNKLKRGHLKGNRFVIRVRGVPAAAVLGATRTLRALCRTGAPNRVGEQRFGMLGNNHLVGRALLLDDRRGALDLLLGPSEQRPDAHAEARALYAQGKYSDALHAFPPSAHTERRTLAALARGLSPRRAIETIERTERSFYVTAFQSAVFNAVLDERIARGLFDRLLEGDLAFKHDSGAVFSVDAPTLADPDTGRRLAGVEISPSGPMWGPEMTVASGEPAQIEAAALAETGVSLERVNRFAKRHRESMVGQRRPLRVPVMVPDIEGGRDEHGDYVKLRFELPRGSFATSVMQEIMKVHVADEAPEQGEATADAAERGGGGER
jgi:tRNA pseudouridine13 synthase